MVLRMIQQAALLLRAVFNSLPLEDFESEEEVQTMGKKLSEEKIFEWNDFIAMPNNQEAIDFLCQTQAFDLSNIELLADIFLITSNKIKNVSHEQGIAYKQKALLLFSYVSEESKTFDWNRIQKINQLQEDLLK